MPDITMCAGSGDCPLACQCYRAEESGTKPSERQSWSHFAPVRVPVHGDWTCMHFWGASASQTTEPPTDTR
jgi:hypothetical protein